MNEPRRPLLVAMLLVCAWGLIAAGCGGAPVSREEYGRELRGAMTELETAWGETGGAVAPGQQTAAATTVETVGELRRSQLSLRDAGNRLAAITPPEELADDHEALIAGVREMADAVDLLVEAQELAGSDPARARELAREFATDSSFTRVEAAAARIEAAGVDAGL
jgi:hypothetical protein